MGTSSGPDANASQQEHQEQQNLAMEVTQRLRSDAVPPAKPGSGSIPVDTPMSPSSARDSNSNGSEACPTDAARESSSATGPAGPADPERDPSPASRRLSEVPSSIARHFPQLQPTKDGKTNAERLAANRLQSAAIVHEKTQGMTRDERAAWMDRQCDSHTSAGVTCTQVFACYYTLYPEHIPDRAPDPKATEQMEKNWTETAAVRSRQQGIFGAAWCDFSVDGNLFDRSPRNPVRAPAGPKGEAVPGDETHCLHCEKLAKRKDFKRPFQAALKCLGLCKRAAARDGSGSRDDDDDSSSPPTPLLSSTSASMSTAAAKDGLSVKSKKSGVGLRRQPATPTGGEADASELDGGDAQHLEVAPAS